MKRDDAILIIGTTIISSFIAILVSVLFNPSFASMHQQITSVNTINITFQPPSGQYFNSTSIDPTRLVEISNNSNSAPFIH